MKNKPTEILIFNSIRMRKFSLILYLLICLTDLFAQADTTGIKRIPVDTSRMLLNMDAVYNRPFLQAGKIPIAIGGYAEAHSSYFATDGITDGLEFQVPNLTVFMASNIKNRIKFLSEVAFVEGGKSVVVDFAAMDISLHPLLNLRGGIILNPIGGFNQNHDAPKWDFISRPLSSTTIIPSTWCNAGFGIFGKYSSTNFAWGYEAYISNGFDDHIIKNGQSRTWLAATKENPNRFEESSNGGPLVTIKTAIRHRKVGEIGFSWMGGVYNQFQQDGITLDKQRRVDLVAIDFNTVIPKLNTFIYAEYVLVVIDIPTTYTQQFGNRQQGGFIDVVQPILRKPIFGWENTVLNLNFRFEYADYNIGTFTETGGNISDHVFGIVPGISFRPSPQTVIRANYSYYWQTDLLGNPPVQVAGFQFGFATYF